MLNNEWVVGILTSILAALILSFLLSVFSRRARTALHRGLLRLTRAGVHDYFPTQNAASKEICEAFKQAKEIRILAVRAWSIFPVVTELSQLGNVLRDKGKDCSIRVLLINPFLEESSGKRPFILERAAEVKEIYRKDVSLRHQVAMTIDILRGLKKEGFDVEVRLYDELPVFKLLIFDHNAFVGGFSRANVGRNNPLYHVVIWRKLAQSAVEQAEERSNQRQSSWSTNCILSQALPGLEKPRLYNGSFRGSKGLSSFRKLSPARSGQMKSLEERSYHWTRLNFVRWFNAASLWPPIRNTGSGTGYSLALMRSLRFKVPLGL